MSNSEWDIIVNHRADLLSQDLILGGIYHHANLTEFGLSFDYPGIRYEHVTGNVYWKVAQMEEIANKLLSTEQYVSLIESLEAQLAAYRSYLDEFEGLVEGQVVTSADIEEFFERSAVAVSSIARFQLEKGIARELERLGIPGSALRSSVTATTEASNQLSRIAARYPEAVASGELGGELEAELEDFCGRFGYLGMKYFLGHPWTVWEAFEMLRTARPVGNAEPEQTTYDSPYLVIANALMRLRTEKWEVMCLGCSLFREAMQRQFSHIVEYNDLLSLRVDEVIGLLEGLFPERKVLGERDAFLLELGERGVELKAGQIVRTETAERLVVDEIKGMVAQAGIVTGRVKVVLSPKDCSKVEDGDVLVATMSTPDFLPGMVRAAAFVTDIGGITSHAAIVSREMKKPCIIGTKIATKALRDGDVVEVDARKGVVKIIKRKK